MGVTLDGFREDSFTYEGKTRAVYRRGAGPGVVVMHEIPGIHPGVMSFAGRVADAGFSVAMPLMFGTPGKPVSTGYILAADGSRLHQPRVSGAGRAAVEPDHELASRALPQPPR